MSVYFWKKAFVSREHKRHLQFLNRNSTDCCFAEDTADLQKILLILSALSVPARPGHSGGKDLSSDPLKILTHTFHEFIVVH